MKEIEKKFLIEDVSNLDLNKYEKEEIHQDYLYKDTYTVVRRRKITKDGKERYLYTVKSSITGGLGVEELENEIPKEVYDNFVLNENNHPLEKTRYIIPYIDGLKIELDIFKGYYKGIMFAEIEYNSEEQYNNIEIPSWFGKELTKKVSNNAMARLTREEIDNMIKNS